MFCLLDDDDGVSRRGDVWAPVSHYFLWILVWPMRPILAVNCRPQSSQMTDLVLSEDSSAGTDWLVEPFHRLRFSSALAIRTSSKCCTPVEQAFRHLGLLQARSSQVIASMPFIPHWYLHHVAANLFKKLCAKFHHNCPSFIGDIWKTFWSLFFRTQCRYCWQIWILDCTV